MREKAEMKCRLYCFNDDGKTLWEEKVEFYFASSEEPPLIIIGLEGSRLNKQKTKHISIDISERQLANLINNRIDKQIRKYRKGKELEGSKK